MISSPQQETVDAAITSRRSIRAFLDKPVDREDIRSILEVAARAPSGTNTQPWNVYVLTGIPGKDGSYPGCGVKSSCNNCQSERGDTDVKRFGPSGMPGCPASRHACQIHAIIACDADHLLD